MLKINEGDYAYASARIRAKEAKLLGATQFEKMIEAPSAEMAFKVLAEAEYGLGNGALPDVFSYEKLLSDELQKSYGLLLQIAPQPEVVKAFQRRYDYFNLKVLLKAEFSAQDVPDILSGAGTIGKAAIVHMIRERDYGDFTPLMKKAVADVHDVFARTQDPQTIDMILDRASYRQLSSDLYGIDSEFLHRIADILTDSANIRMFIRARQLNKTWDFIKKFILQGGTISETVYRSGSEASADTFAESIRATPYGTAVIKGWELSRIRKDLAMLEKLLDEYLMEFVRRARFITMGVEPLVAWLFAKETEIRNVRIIMTGRINSLPAEVIRERLRAGYV